MALKLKVLVSVLDCEPFRARTLSYVGVPSLKVVSHREVFSVGWTEGLDTI